MVCTLSRINLIRTQKQRYRTTCWQEIQFAFHLNTTKTLVSVWNFVNFNSVKWYIRQNVFKKSSSNRLAYWTPGPNFLEGTKFGDIFAASALPLCCCSWLWSHDPHFEYFLMAFHKSVENWEGTIMIVDVPCHFPISNFFPCGKIAWKKSIEKWCTHYQSLWACTTLATHVLPCSQLYLATATYQPPGKGREGGMGRKEGFQCSLPATHKENQWGSWKSLLLWFFGPSFCPSDFVFQFR